MGAAVWDAGNSRKHILDAVDASLRRLKTDYVDLYQLHMDDPATPLDEMAEAMDTIVRSGKARYIGVSNFLAYRLARVLGRQDTLKLTRFVSVQPRYNLLFREGERELFPLALEDGIAVIPYNPLAGGLLSGRYRRSDTPEKGRFSAELGGFGKLYHAGIGTSGSLRRSARFKKSRSSRERRWRSWLWHGFSPTLPSPRSFWAPAVSSN
jgi:aryl-alcohol dehydrogenase-like predicted oxidoreductase